MSGREIISAYCNPQRQVTMFCLSSRPAQAKKIQPDCCTRKNTALPWSAPSARGSDRAAERLIRLPTAAFYSAASGVMVVAVPAIDALVGPYYDPPTAAWRKAHIPEMLISSPVTDRQNQVTKMHPGWKPGGSSGSPAPALYDSRSST